MVQYPAVVTVAEVVTVAGMSLKRRHANQHHVACPIPRVRCSRHLRSVRIMKRLLQDTCAAPHSQKKTKDAASGSSAALQDTCWKHFRGVERQVIDSYWYPATFNFCAHAERLHLMTGRARAHLDCIIGQNVRICSRCRQKSEIRCLCQPILVFTARLLDNSQHTLRDAFASRDMIELATMIETFTVNAMTRLLRVVSKMFQPSLACFYAQIDPNPAPLARSLAKIEELAPEPWAEELAPEPWAAEPTLLRSLRTLVLNAVSPQSEGCRPMWWYPDVKLREVKCLPPPRLYIRSSIRGQVYVFLSVSLFRAR